MKEILTDDEINNILMITREVMELGKATLRLNEKLIDKNRQLKKENEQLKKENVHFDLTELKILDTVIYHKLAKNKNKLLNYDYGRLKKIYKKILNHKTIRELKRR
jgi:hypothetical protein